MTRPRTRIKTGIFGGSFNPIHNGHIALARQLMRTAELDEVWMMVSPQNPLKQDVDDMADDRLRYLMARVALHGEHGIAVSDLELHMPRPSYTWNTLQRLSAECPEREFTLLIGGDNWQRFGQWHRAADIVRQYKVVVYPRRGSTIDADRLPANVTVADAALLDISSTEIRQRTGQGLSIRHMVPPAIEPLVRRIYCRR